MVFKQGKIGGCHLPAMVVQGLQSYIILTSSQISNIDKELFPTKTSTSGYFLIVLLTRSWVPINRLGWKIHNNICTGTNIAPRRPDQTCETPPHCCEAPKVALAEVAKIKDGTGFCPVLGSGKTLQVSSGFSGSLVCN